nr:hypothetical protein [Lachnospiraceae bacterium]
VGDNGIIEQFVMDCIDTLDVEISDNPDFVFCGDFETHDFLKYDCVRIYINGELEFPDFNVYDYALGSLHLEMGDRYRRFPFYLWRDGTAREFEESLRRNKLPDSAFNRKFCNYIVSNGAFVNPVRHQFFELLSGYRCVDSGGLFCNNIGYQVENKDSFQRDYKFSLTFENESYPGYITEKIVEAYNAGTIPIYWGAADIGQEFNENAFINVSDYHTLDEAIKYIRFIDEDRESYMRILNEPLIKDTSMSKSIYDNDEAGVFIREILLRGRESAYRRTKYGRPTIIESRYKCDVYAKMAETIMSQEIPLSEWLRKMNSGSVYIYGAGLIGKILSDVFNRNGIRIDGMIDCSKSGNYKNVDILSADGLCLEENALVVNTVYGNKDALKRNLDCEVVDIFEIVETIR